MVESPQTDEVEVIRLMSLLKTLPPSVTYFCHCRDTASHHLRAISDVVDTLLVVLEAVRSSPDKEFANSVDKSKYRVEAIFKVLGDKCDALFFALLRLSERPVTGLRPVVSTYEQETGVTWRVSDEEPVSAPLPDLGKIDLSGTP